MLNVVPLYLFTSVLTGTFTTGAVVLFLSPNCAQELNKEKVTGIVSNAALRNFFIKRNLKDDISIQFLFRFYCVYFYLIVIKVLICQALVRLLGPAIALILLIPRL